ncbi:MAG: hypothetical protein V2J55_09960 [Candidatus Competibacteraceae bacterium]|jgi:hypothetical protein|nr:hypothetical protein [Candidatus Competibacteraceae bacterium]
MLRRLPLYVVLLALNGSAYAQRGDCLNVLNLSIWDIGFSPIPAIPIPPEPIPPGASQHQESPSTAPTPAPVEPSHGRSLLDQAL